MLTRLLTNVVLNSIVLLITTMLIPGTISVNGGVSTYIYFGIIFGLSNTILKPILNIVTLPLRFLTLGMSVIIVNSIILYFTDIGLEILFQNEYDLVIQGGSSYLIAGLAIGTINWIKNLIK